MSETTEALFAERKRLIARLILDRPMFDEDRLILAMDCYQKLADGASMHQIISRIDSEPQPAVGVITPAALEGVSPPLSVFPSASAV